MKTVKVTITGPVQGVWFRAWAEGEARKLGLDGWVRNRRDGAVEALLHGPAEAVGQMVAACRIGPPAARVAGIAESAAEPPERAGFNLRPTV